MMRAMCLRWLLRSGLGALLCVAVLGGCREGAAARGETDGEALYGELCARCHGPAGSPTESMVARHGVKDLTSSEVLSEMNDDEIREQILKGSKNREMPAFQGAVSDEQVEAVIDYVRTLSE